MSIVEHRHLYLWPNTAATRADCQQGRRVEVKFVYDGTTRTSRAEWVKIAAE